MALLAVCSFQIRKVENADSCGPLVYCQRGYLAERFANFGDEFKTVAPGHWRRDLEVGLVQTYETRCGLCKQHGKRHVGNTHLDYLCNH